MQWKSYIPTKMANQNSSDEITQTPVPLFRERVITNSNLEISHNLNFETQNTS